MRALSDAEWAQCYQDNRELIFGLMPEQSKIVSWNGMPVLIYVGPNSLTVEGQIYPDVYMSDVSNAPQLAAVSQGGYGTTPPQSMLDTLPQAVVDTVKEDAAKVGALVNQLGQGLKAAAASVGSGIETVLIIALVVLALIYLPGRR